MNFVRKPDGRPFLRYIPFDPALINDDGVIRLYYGTLYPFQNYKNLITRKIFDKVESKMFGKSMKELKAEPEGVMGPTIVMLAKDWLYSGTATFKAHDIYPLYFEFKGKSKIDILTFNSSHDKIQVRG